MYLTDGVWAEASIRQTMQGEVCVTGGTGYIASWLIKRLLQRGYTVRTTVRSPQSDVSFLTTLPAASERLRICYANLGAPDSFAAAVEGCVGVFHIAHPTDLGGAEPEPVVTQRSVDAALGILRACLNSKTVRRVVYTSSASAVAFRDAPDDAILDEGSWSDVDYARARVPFGVAYVVSKTLTEKAVLEFGEKQGLDVVSLVPTFVLGPFLGPRIPGSVSDTLAMVLGKEEQYGMLINISMVHVDDLASAHIFLLESPRAKGRYICSSDELSIREMAEFLSAKYPQFPIPTPDSVKDVKGPRMNGMSSKKLLDAGFKYKYGLDEMYDEAIQCCKEMGLL